MNSGGPYAHPNKKQIKKGKTMGFFKGVGKFFNDISGATSAAEQSYAYNKEFAQNAHQWEVADMEKAGLNPILSADGSGATGNVSPVSGGGQMATGLLNSILDFSIMGKQNDIAQQDVNAKSALATAEAQKTDAETFRLIMENNAIPQKIKQDLAEQKARTMLLGKQTDLTQQQAGIAYNQNFWSAEQQKYQTNSMYMDYQQKVQEYNEKLYQNIINSSEAEFVKRYGMTKDQGIKLIEATGTMFGHFTKPKPNTNQTSAKKGK